MIKKTVVSNKEFIPAKTAFSSEYFDVENDFLLSYVNSNVVSSYYRKQLTYKALTFKLNFRNIDVI